MIRRSHYHDDAERLARMAVTTVKMSAVEGRVPFGSMLQGAARSLADMIHTGYASVTFAGDRAPAIGKCVGCRAITSKAWHVMPVGITVAACCPDCVADRVELIWSDAGEHIAVRQPVAVLEDVAAVTAAVEAVA